MQKLFSLSLFLISLSLFFESTAQTRTTVQDGPWNDPATWGGVAPPDFNVGAITVNHSVTVDAPSYTPSLPLVVDQLTVSATGNLSITSGSAVQINNGGGTDLTVNTTGSLTINAGADFFINRGVTFNTSNTNTVFNTGSVIRTSGNTLPLATGLNGIDIHIQNVVNADLNLDGTWSQTGAGTNLFITCPNLGNNFIDLNGSVNLLNRLEILDTDGNNGGRVTILNGNGTTSLNVGSGGISVQGNSRLFIATSGTVTVNVNGDFVFNSSSTNHSQLASSGSGLINLNSGDVVMTNGLWRMISGGNGGSGIISLNGAGSDLLVTGGVISEEGSGVAQGTFSFTNTATNQILNWPAPSVGIGTINVTLDKSSTSLDLQSPLTVSGLTLTSGTLVTNGNDLSLSGAVVVGTGQIDATTSTPASALSILGTGALASPIPFVAGSVLSNLTLNRAGASLALSNVSIEDQGLVTLTAGTIAAPLGALGVYDLLYNNTAALTTGNEIPLSPTVLRNLTKINNGAVTLSSSPTINGDLAINGGSINAGASNVNLLGNFINNAPFIQAAGGTFTFLDNVHSLSGTSTATFGILVINGTLNVSNTTSTLLNNMTVNTGSALNATSGTFAFNGTTTIVHNGTLIQFNNVSIGNGSTLTAPLNNTFSVAGNFSGNGTFIANGSTVNFNGTSILSGNGKVFHNITVSSASSLGGNVNFTIQNNLDNSGSINFTGGSLTWNSNGNFSGNSPATFNRIVIPVTRNLNLILTADLTLLAELANSGNVNHSVISNVIMQGNLSGGGSLTSLGTFRFSGPACVMGGGGLKTFTNLEVPGTLTINPAVSYTLNNGTLNVTGTHTTNNGTGSVTITGNVTVVNTGLETTMNNLVISGTLNASGTLNLLRNFTNNGSFNAGTGTVAFSGIVTQNILGSSVTTFNNMNINNATAFVNVQSNQNLQGILTLAPLSNFDADGTSNSSIFTILSTSSIPVQDGAIASLPVDATLNGNITVQRFMQNSGNVNRYISSPISNMTVTQFADDFTLQPNTIRQYIESIPGAITRGYSGISNTAPLIPGRGYLAYMWDAVDVTWDGRGNINRGSISLPVTYTNSGLPEADGWNLVGNPYPSGIVWQAGPGWSLTNIDPVISVPDLSITTGYPTYYHTANFNDNTGDLPNNYIAMGQAFWVHASAPGASLVVNENAKNPATGGNFYRVSSSPSEQLIISINNGKFQDKTFLKLNSLATRGFDPLFDGYKLKNEWMNIYLLDDEKRNLVMHTLSGISADEQIPLGIEVKEAGTYAITFDNTEGFQASSGLFLVDKQENTVTAVTSTEPYTFTITDITKPITNRFYLTSNATVALAGEGGNWLDAYPNPVSDRLTVSIHSDEMALGALYDAQGKIVWTNNISGSESLDFQSLPSGMYFLKVQLGSDVQWRKIIKK